MELTKNDIIKKYHTFKSYYPDIENFIKNDQQNLLILRLILKKSVKDFSGIINVSYGLLSQWERNKRNLPERYINNISDKFKENLDCVPKIDEIISVFEGFKIKKMGAFLDANYARCMREKAINSISWGERQRKACESMHDRKSSGTPEESEIRNMLKKNNTPFEEQVAIIEPGKTRAGAVVADFIIPKNGKPKIVIETSRFGQHWNFITTQATILSHRGFRLKKHKPHLTLIALIRTNSRNDERIVEMLKESFDIVIKNDFEKVIPIIKNIGAEDGICSKPSL